MIKQGSNPYVLIENKMTIIISMMWGSYYILNENKWVGPFKSEFDAKNFKV